MKTNQSIGQVAKALKDGLPVRRPSMGGAFVFHAPGSTYSAVVVAALASVGAEFVEGGKALIIDKGHDPIEYRFSVEDVFAEDWIIDDGDTTEQLPGFAVAGETVGKATPT